VREISTNQYFAAKLYTPNDEEEIENVRPKTPKSSLFFVLFFKDP